MPHINIVSDPKDPKPKEDKKNDGYDEEGVAKKIVNEQDQQNVSNQEVSANGDESATEAVKPQLNEDTGEQRDFSTADSMEAERKKQAGINP